mmetsp:Transcript_9425/g.17142  ORF Transcript_9425/g.17142 Transcript_9425/m.17142 type:complete len:207 (+) Transcript_9425:178-798(+)
MEFRVRGQSPEMDSARPQFRTEATQKFYTGRACGCLCKTYRGIFPVGEDSGAADEEAPCAQPDPQVLTFISAADFKQGLKRVNEMMEKFVNRSTPFISLTMCGSLALMMWTILASSIDNFAGISNYPGWAVGIGWVAVIGSFAVAMKETQKQEEIFRENVETALKEVWKNAVAQGVSVAFKNEHSGSGDDNTTYPAAVTITLPYHA